MKPEKNKSLSFVSFGCSDWWYHNRSHIDMQLTRRFARRGASLYVNSIVMGKFNFQEGRRFFQKLIRKTKSIFRGLKKTETGFWVYSPFALPVHHIRLAKPANDLLLRLQIGHVTRKLGLDEPVVLVGCPAACDVAIRMKRKKLVYQRIDRFEDFPGVERETIRKFDRRLKAEADLTLFVNTSLYEKEGHQCKKAVYLDHGVDFDMFASAAENPSKPSDISSIPGPIIGFFGTIDDANPDLDFLGKVADLLPRMSFVLVGRAQTDCSALTARSNVWMLGQKPYESIPEYGKCFAVALLPVQQNPWTEAVNPLKLKEYLALGKPVVSRPFPELAKYSDVVYEAQTPHEFARCIEKALCEDNPDLVAKRRKRVESASWDSKAEMLLHELFTDENEEGHRAGFCEKNPTSRCVRRYLHDGPDAFSSRLGGTTNGKQV
jgi:glycosyltransferase involved in cell wall biosynthesis